MTLPDLPPPRLIEDAAGLAELLADLEGQAEIAVDTEADSFFSYREKVCLVQVTVEDRDYLVDPLADGLDLAPLGPVLADPHKTKVFHDGEYDVLILKREYGFDFASLFDTRVAAAALGSESPGLAAVLSDRFQIELDKAMQRSDWSARPLTAQQIAYARLDTRYLLPLMREQREELERAGRTRIVDGECRRLEALVPTTAAFDPDEFARIKGARNLAPVQRRALRELFVLRERLACERDVPPFRILNQHALLELARRRPRSRNDLKEVPGFTWKQVRRLGDEVLDVLGHAAEMDPIERLPAPPRRGGDPELGEEEQELHDRLKTWRKDRAIAQKIDSSLVLNRHVLLRIAQERPTERAALERVDGLLDWQLADYADDLLALVRHFEKDVAAGRVEIGRRKSRRRGPGRS